MPWVIEVGSRWALHAEGDRCDRRLHAVVCFEHSPRHKFASLRKPPPDGDSPEVRVDCQDSHTREACGLAYCHTGSLAFGRHT